MRKIKSNLQINSPAEFVPEASVFTSFISGSCLALTIVTHWEISAKCPWVAGTLTQGSGEQARVEQAPQFETSSVGVFEAGIRQFMKNQLCSLASWNW